MACYKAVLDGRKTFELRADDRNFAVGDLLWLREYEPQLERYTGRSLHVRVSYKLLLDPVTRTPGRAPDVPPVCACIMSIERVSDPGASEC